MIFEVDVLDKEQWKPLSEKAHLICFDEYKPADWDRIDFALIVKNASDLLCYCTCRELDSRTLYWQYGGAFPGTRGSSVTFKAYKQLVEWTKGRYDRVATMIENTNTAMLKMAMAVGFRIIGTRNFGGKILVEHMLEFA